MKKRDKLVQLTHKFLQKRWDSECPLLLALSGGPDSMALLQALIHCNVYPAIAHVNHRWREESDAEAQLIEKLVVKHGLAFHIKILKPEGSQSNLEEKGRVSRLNFFRGLCQSFGYQAVLLGHHADDQAETVLKRVLEGASLTQLRGMTEVSEWKGMPLWRPLLSVTKKELIEWLDELGVEPFEDVTNHDPKFLRGRMRSQLIPNLEESFGKGVRHNLCRLADQAALLSEHLDERLHTILSHVERNSRETHLDLTQSEDLTILEMQHLVKAFGATEGVVLSREIVEQMASHLKNCSPDKHYHMDKWSFHVHQGHLFAKII